MRLGAASQILVLAVIVGACGTSSVCTKPAFSHRASAVACPADRAPSLTTPIQPPDGGVFACATDADCTQFPNRAARCLLLIGGGTECSYDECYADSDCNLPFQSKSLCLCGPSPIGAQTTRGAHVCGGGECAIDADCPAGSFCSQATVVDLCFGPGKQGAAFFCRSCNEACTSDADCASLGPTAYCTFLGVDGKRWGCAVPTKCAG